MCSSVKSSSPIPRRVAFKGGFIAELDKSTRDRFTHIANVAEQRRQARKLSRQAVTDELENSAQDDFQLELKRLIEP